MTRALVTTLALSTTLTALSVWANLIVHTTAGPTRVLADFSRLAAFGSWLIVAMMWCTQIALSSYRCGWEKVGRKVSTKVDKLETHLDESIAEVRSEVGERLDAVEGVIGEIDKERVQANAVVLELFRNKRVR